MFRSVLKAIPTSATHGVPLQTRALSAAPTIIPHFVLFYQYVPDVATKRAPHRAGGSNSSLLLSLSTQFYHASSSLHDVLFFWPIQ